MLWECKEGCQLDQPKSKGHPRECEKHGRHYVYTKALGSKPRKARARPRKPMRRTEPKREWTDAHAKVDIEARCRVCGYEGDGLETAHVMGRKYDQPAHTGTRTLYVNPLDVVPLCPVFAPEKCHHRYDHKELDLLPFLAPEEQTRAVEVAGGIEAARKRVAPLRHREEVEESAYVPDEELPDVTKTTNEAVADGLERSAA